MKNNNPAIKYLLLYVIIESISAETSRLKVCQEMRYFLERLNDPITINVVSTWIYLIGCGYAILQEGVLFILYLFNRDLRQSPGDIFLGSLIFEFFLALQWFRGALESEQKKTLQNFSFQCQFIAALNIFGSCGGICYSLAFFYYLKQQAGVALSAKVGQTWKLHLTILLICLTIVLLTFSLSLNGKTVDGLCGIQISRINNFLVIILLFILFAIYMFVAIFSIAYFQRSIPKSHLQNITTQQFLKFSKIYLISFASMSSITAIFALVILIFCSYFNSTGLEVFICFENIFAVSTLIILPIIRCTEPYTKKTLLRIFHQKEKTQSLLRYDSTKQVSIELNLNKINSHNDSISEFSLEDSQGTEEKKFDFNEDPPLSENNSQSTVKTIMIDQDNKSIVNILQSNLRSLIMYKIICCVLIEEKGKYHKLSIKQQNLKSQSNIFEEKTVFEIFDEDYTQELPELEPTSFFEKQQENVSVKMVAYAPLIFHSITTREQEKVDLKCSLNIKDNLQRIKSSSKNDGGKSGQFFFFSFDNRIMMKTVTPAELKILLSKLKSYYDYVQENTTTLIAKIYGVYSFEGLSERPVHIIIMKNLARCNQSCVLRIYDLKGSSYDREVAKNKNIDINKVVLKDLDFIKLEKQLEVEQFEKEKIIANSLRDALFFQSVGLIDYSLIIFKINWIKMRELHAEAAEYLEHFGQHVYQSKTNRDIRYHIGIIDYLQMYDVQKKMEKFSKKMLKLNKNLDTSSQDPKTYCDRFSSFVSSIIISENQ